MGYSISGNDVNNEEERVKSLKKYQIIGTPSESDFDAIAALAKYICDVPFAVISFIDEKRVWFKSHIGTDIEELPRELSFCQYTIQQNEVFEIPDTLIDSRFADNPFVKGEPFFRFYAGYPIVAEDGYNIGTICIFDFKPRNLNSEQKHGLATLGESVASVLKIRFHKAKLENEQENYKLLYHDLKHSHKSIPDGENGSDVINYLQEKLAVVENRFKYFIESAQDSIYEIDGEHGFVYVNPTFVNTTGYTTDELKNEQYWGLIAESFRSRVKKFYIKQIAQRRDVSYLEFLIISKSGKKVWIGQNVKIEYNDCGYKTIRTIARDITPLRKAKLKLKRRERLFRLLSENSSDIISLLNKDKSFVYTSPAIKAVLGYKTEELTGKSITSIADPKDIQAFNDLFEKSNQKGKAVSTSPIRIIGKNKTKLWTEISIKPIYNKNGVIINYHSCIKNITIKKRIQEALMASEQRYKLLSQHAPVGIIQSDINGRWIFVNKWFLSLTGYQEVELTGTNWPLCIHPADKSKVLEMLEKRRNEISGEFRLVHATTREDIWVAANIISIKNEHNITTGFLASLKDITQNKKTEAQLRLNEKRLQEVEEIANFGGWELNLKDKEVVWTKQTYIIHELPFDHELNYEEALSFYPDEARETLVKALNNTITTGETFELEIEHVTAKNNKQWVRLKGKAHQSNGVTYKLSGSIRDITERWITESELNKSITILDAIVKNLHAGILVEDENGNLALVNDFFCEIFKVPVPAKVLIGRGRNEMINEAKDFFADGDDFAARILKAIEDQEPILNEEVILKDGRIYERDFIPINPDTGIRGNIIIYRDINLRKQQENFIKKKQNELKAFIESAPVAIALFDSEIRYLAASEKWLFDYDLQNRSILGVYHFDLYSPHSDKWKPILERCLAGSIESNLEDAFQNDDSSTDWIRWEVRPWTNASDEIGGLIIMTENVTHKKQQELELIIAKQKAEEAARAKDQFLSTVSHELRTPMNAVIGITQILLEEKPRPDQVENLKTLKFSANHLLALINDILDFNKIESGNVILEEVDFNLQDLLKGVKQTFDFKAEEKNLNFSLVFDDNIPELISGDPFRLSQILTNLIGNAMKFTDSGSVTIKTILERESPEDVLIHFSVEDTGIGIPRDMQSEIFERFTQASTDTTRKFGGTGLGLAITKKLIALMGSQISLDSDLGKGSNFGFPLTFKRAQMKGKVLIDEYLQIEMKNLSYLQLKILVAEDNLVNQYVAGKFLSNWGIDADFAENGAIALEMMEQKKYDLVLMDLQMPVMDGYEATKRLRLSSNDYNKNLSVLALTASAMLDVKDMVFKTGMNDYITKPFNPTELYKKILMHLSPSIKAKRIHAYEGLNSKIKVLAENHPDISDELKVLYKEAFREIKEQSKICMDSNDLQEFRSLIHKHRSTLQMLDLKNLSDELELGRQLLETGNTEQHAFTSVVDNISRMCNDLISELVL